MNQWRFRAGTNAAPLAATLARHEVAGRGAVAIVHGAMLGLLLDEPFVELTAARSVDIRLELALRALTGGAPVPVAEAMSLSAAAFDPEAAALAVLRRDPAATARDVAASRPRYAAGSGPIPHVGPPDGGRQKTQSWVSVGAHQVVEVDGRSVEADRLTRILSRGSRVLPRHDPPDVVPTNGHGTPPLDGRDQHRRSASSDPPFAGVRGIADLVARSNRAGGHPHGGSGPDEQAPEAPDPDSTASVSPAASLRTMPGVVTSSRLCAVSENDDDLGDAMGLVLAREARRHGIEVSRG